MSEKGEKTLLIEGNESFDSPQVKHMAFRKENFPENRKEMG
jgi:hypothetical protein